MDPPRAPGELLQIYRNVLESRRILKVPTMLRPLLVSASIAAVIGFALLATCSRESGKPEPSAAQQAHPTAGGDTIDPMSVFADPDGKVAPAVSRFKELPFIEFSEGLPTSGTWLGMPLLQDFNGDGLADLIASNREEDGFNAWRTT